MGKEYDIAAAFAKIENELISSIMRNFKRHRAEEKAEGYNWEQWQVVQLKALDDFKKECKKKYPAQFLELNSQIDKILKETYSKGEAEQEKKILNAIKKGFTLPDNNPTESAATQGEFFKVNQNKLDALVEATTHDMKKAETAVLRRADDRYRKIIFNAQVYANTGAGTYEKAVDMATKDFLSAGIDCIEYKNGSRHSIAGYAKMAIQTASKRAYFQGEGAKRKEMGIPTVILNKRSNPCPLCAPFVGKVFIDDVWSGGDKSGISPVTGLKYPLLSDAISKGLYHPNCHDSHTTYFEGISTPPEDSTYTADELDEMAERYRAEQQKGYCERQLNKYEKLEKYSLDKDNKAKYGAKAEAWKQKARALKEKLKNTIAKFIKSDIIKERLSESEEAAINSYMSSDSYKINEKLRTGIKLNDEEQTVVDNLDLALKKVPKYEGTVYRSLSSDMMSNPEEFWNNHSVNNIISYEAFTSTSTSVYDESMDIQMIIKSKNGRDIRKYNFNESEILFSRNSMFYVSDVKNNIIYLEEI